MDYEKMKKKFEKIVEFFPAFDKRDINPYKDKGIGSVAIKFILKGKKGVIQLSLLTDWYLPKTIEEYMTKGLPNISPPIILRKQKDFLIGFDLGYHAYKKQYEGQEITNKKCSYLDNKPCYYDGSCLQADRFVNILLESGSEKVWEELEKEYRERFQ